MTITLDQFTDREIIYCVSSLVSAIQQDMDFEAAYEISVQDNYAEPASNHLLAFTEDNEEMVMGICKDLDVSFLHNVENTVKELINECYRNNVFAAQYCEHQDLEPYQNEAYEHWIVTEWLATCLEAKGEMVSHNLYGLVIWGRCTTGQCISMDNVIQEIYAERIRNNEVA